jgi:dTDP-4-amino-4,6-dideoxygalactose transaminase
MYKSEKEINDIKRRIGSVYEDSRWSNGAFTEMVEESATFDLLLRDRVCMPCANGTLALACAIEYSMVKERYTYSSKILLPECGPAALIQSVKMSGMMADRIMYYNIKSNFDIDIEDIRRIGEDNNIGCIVMVDFGGVIPESAIELQKYCIDNHIMLIEDFSHAQLCRRNGMVAGNIGDISICSMYATKSLSSGEGGLLCVSKDDYREIYPFWNAGRNFAEKQVMFLGMNCRASEFQVAIMYSRIKSYIQEIRLRKIHASMFDKCLSGSVGLVHKDFSGIENFNFYKYIIKFKTVHEKNMARDSLLELRTGDGYIFITNDVCPVNFTSPSSGAVDLNKYLCLNIENQLYAGRVSEVIRSVVCTY